VPYPKPQANANYKSIASLWIKQYYQFHSPCHVLYGSTTVSSTVTKHAYCMSSPLSLLLPNILLHCYHSKYATADNMVCYHWSMSNIKKFEPEPDPYLGILCPWAQENFAPFVRIQLCVSKNNTKNCGTNIVFSTDLP
jgi:hypothetical protein